MKILIIGDIVGNSGVKKVKEVIPNYVNQNKIDFVIANGENSADGMGITLKIYEDLKKSKVDVVTMGNHTWGKKEIFNFIEDENIVRPANYPEGVPGKGYNIYEKNGKNIAVINLIGRVDIAVLSDDFFDHTKDNFKTLFPFQDSEGKEPFKDDIINTWIMGPHNCWYIGSSNGLTEINLTTGRVRRLLNYYVRDLGFKSDKELWVGTESGLYIYDLEKG